jgi:hypothetical protein
MLAAGAQAQQLPLWGMGLQIGLPTTGVGIIRRLDSAWTLHGSVGMGSIPKKDWGFGYSASVALLWRTAPVHLHRPSFALGVVAAFVHDVVVPIYDADPIAFGPTTPHARDNFAFGGVLGPEIRSQSGRSVFDFVLMPLIQVHPHILLTGGIALQYWLYFAI